jgi:hypothetical protein
MLIDDVIGELRKLNHPLSLSMPRKLPTEGEIRAAEEVLGVVFHPDYRKFLLQASDVDFGIIEPATVTDIPTHTNIVHMAQAAWNLMALPRDLLPICEDNGDYYCLNTIGEVVYWSHNGVTNERWPNLATWIKQVWISRQ